MIANFTTTAPTTVTATDIAALRNDLTAAVAEAAPMTALDGAVGVYNYAARLIEALQAVQADAKRTIGDVLAELNLDKAQTPNGAVAIVKATPTVTYNAKALDVLCADDEDLAARLAPYRKVTEKAPYLRVEQPGAAGKGQ